MNLTRLQVLNQIAATVKAKSYLEIGVQAGHVFNGVFVQRKVGVDPDPESAATVIATSDDYFQTLPEDVKFDLIFIDGLHLAEQVERDVESAIRHIAPRGFIALHDCDPPSEAAGGREMCPGVWCGDVWKAWTSLRWTLSRPTFTIDTDLGLGVILPEGMEAPAPQRKVRRQAPSIDWPTFQASRHAALGLVAPIGFTRWLRAASRR